MVCMSTSESAVTWEAVEKRVLDSFDRSDPVTRSAVDEWLRHVEKNRKLTESGEIIHSFASPEVIDAAVDFFRAGIEDNMAIHRLKAARNRRKMAFMHVQVSLGEHDAFFVDEESGDRVMPEHLAVRRLTKEAIHRMMSKVVDFARGLARGEKDLSEGAALESISEDIPVFADDLNAFLTAHGDKGRDVVIRICGDREFADNISEDESMPAPLRFLAGIVVKTAGECALLESNQRAGFAR